jgi:hypothetical protein
MGPIEIVILVILLIWLTGTFIVPVGGSFIHVLLVVVLILFLVRILRTGGI